MRTINLIPQEGKRQDESRRRVLLLAGLGALFLVLLGALTIWRQGAVRDAEDALNEQIATNNGLQSQINALAGAEDLQNEFNAGVATLALALQNDVEWGTLLSDLGRLIPDQVWVETYTGSVNRGQLEAGIGQITFSGTAFTPPDVANWLRVLDSDRYPGVVGSWASAITASSIADVDVVTFTSTTNLNDAALSDRLAERTPEIP